jgi:hypothetical protein
MSVHPIFKTATPIALLLLPALLSFGCKTDTLISCESDEDCVDACAFDQIATCEVPMDETQGVCECELRMQAASVELEFPYGAGVNGGAFRLDGSVETDGRTDLLLGFKFQPSVSDVMMVEDVATGNPLIEAPGNAFFDFGVEVPASLTDIRARFDCLDAGDAAWTAGLYDAEGLVGDEVPFEVRCFEQASGIGDAFLSLDQPVSWDGAQWVDTSAGPGIVALLRFPSEPLQAATARFNDQCTGSIAVSEFTSLEFASAYRKEPLNLDAVYTPSSSAYEFPNPPTGSSVFNSQMPYAVLRDLDTGLEVLSLSEQPPAAPPIPGNPAGVDTSFTFGAGAAFGRFSLSGDWAAGTLTLDCIMQLDGATTVDGLPASASDAPFIDAFYRNADADADLTNAGFYVGTWSANVDLVFSGGYGVSSTPGDFGFGAPGAWFESRYTLDGD